MARPHELLDVERVAAALAIQPGASGVIDLRSDQGPRLLGGEERGLEPAPAADADGALERSEQPRRSLAIGDRHQRRSAEPPEQMGEHFDRRGVGPVDVIEREHQRLPARQPLEYAPDRVVEPVPLGALPPARAAFRLPGQRREDLGELPRDVFVKRPEHDRLERAEVVVERVDDQAERDVELELGRAALEHQIPTILAAATELREQPRLPDPGLTHDLHAPRLAGSELVKRSFEFSELAGTANERAHMLIIHLDPPGVITRLLGAPGQRTIFRRAFGGYPAVAPPRRPGAGQASLDACAVGRGWARTTARTNSRVTRGAVSGEGEGARRSESPGSGQSVRTGASAGWGRRGRLRQLATISAPTAHRPADTTAATFQPWAGEFPPTLVTMLTTSATPAAPPRYRAVLFAPLPIPARSGGTDSTAIRPSPALAMPLPTPATSSPGTSAVHPLPAPSPVRAASPAAHRPRPIATRARAPSLAGSDRAASATTMLVTDHAHSTHALRERADVQSPLHQTRGDAHQAGHREPCEQGAADGRQEVGLREQAGIDERTAAAKLDHRESGE